jgi:HK97 family phage portal protein
MSIVDSIAGLFGRSPKAVFPQLTTAESYLTQAGVAVTEDRALALPAMFAGVRALSEDVASTPLPLYARSSDGRKTAFWHPLYVLLHGQPNPCMTPISFKEGILYSAIMRGAGHIYIERGTTTVWDERGDPIALWPLRSDKIITAIEGGQRRYVYLDSHDTTSELDPRNVIPVPGFSKEGVFGLGVHKYGAESVGAGIAAEQYAASYFGNGTQVGGTLHIPAGLVLSEKAKERLQQTLVDNRGSDRAFKARLLEDGITWEPGGVAPKEAQMLEQRQFTTTQVAQFLRITPDKLQDLTHATYSNIEQQDINYMKWSLRPWFTRLEQALNCFLLSDRDRASGYYFEHITEALLVGDIKTQYEAFGVALDKGFMNRDEIRARINLNNIKGGAGKAFLVQSAQTTLDLVVAGANVGEPKKQLDSPDDPEPMMESPAE